MSKKQPIDLDACKRTACLMASIEPIPNPAMPQLLVMHPFSAYRQTHIPRSTFPKDHVPNIDVVDIVDDVDGRAKWQNSLITRILEAKKLDHILFIMNGPYMMNYLRLIKNYIYDKKVLAEYLRYCWTNQEFPNWNERGHSLRTCLSMFRKVRNDIMDNEEQSYYDSLPEVVTIYRGQYHTKKSKPYPALSWTSDPKRALWFVTHRYQPNGILYKGTIKKEHIMCYLNNRGEQELIIDYTKIENIEEVNYDQ